jgi:pimeloyl-ACP methyl ester carboxylesterase
MAQVLTSSDGVGLRLTELRSGGPDTLLMLHGVGRAGRTFSALATMLPARFRILALDFRGHGESGRAGAAYRIMDYLQDALAAIDALPGQVAVYGHSLGSLVAAASAAARPGRVAAVLLEDPPSATFWAGLAETQYHPTFEAMQRWAGRVDLGVAELAEKLGNEVVKSWPDGRVLRIRDVRDAVSLRFSAACCRQLDPAVMTTILEGRWMQGFSYEQSFGEVRCPALLMRGDPARGGMLSEDDATALAALLHDPVRLDFPTAGHLLHWQVRSELAGLASAFLECL